MVKENGILKVLFKSVKPIQENEELFFNYNDRRKKILKTNVWLN